MDELKPNNYYSLKYSVIPNNKIKQIIGTYKSAEPVQVEYQSNVTSVYDLLNSTSALVSLPCFSERDLADDSSLYSNKFKHLDISAYNGNILPGVAIRERSEEIWAKLTIDILNDSPMYFENNSVTVSYVSGIHRERIKTDSGIYISLGWLENFSVDEYDGNVYCVRNYNLSGTGWPTSQKISNTSVDISTAEIGYANKDSYYDGTHLYNGRYLLRLEIMVRIYNGYLHVLYQTGESAQGGLEFESLDSITFNIPYEVHNEGQETEFEFHVTDSDYEEYPLRISGNEYTNENVFYRKTPDREIIWCEWISKEILDKYRNGKIFINAKAKLSWLKENDVGINSQIIIKDINNNYISKMINGEMKECIFEVKNIEYECNETEYIANLTLLEIGSIKLFKDVVDSNNLGVITSESKDIVLLKEEEE